MSAIRYVAEEFFGLFDAPFTYWLALLIAFVSWRMLPPDVGLIATLFTLVLLAVDEYREWRAHD